MKRKNMTAILTLLLGFCIIWCTPKSVRADYSTVSQDHGYIRTGFSSFSELVENYIADPSQDYFLTRIDFDSDGDDEVLIFYEEYYAFYWNLYDEKPDGVYLIGTDCGEKPGNAGHDLLVSENGTLIDRSYKGLVSYIANWDTYIFAEQGHVNYLFHFTYIDDPGGESIEENQYWLNGEAINEESFLMVYDGIMPENEEAVSLINNESVYPLTYDFSFRDLDNNEDQEYFDGDDYFEYNYDDEYEDVYEYDNDYDDYYDYSYENYDAYDDIDYDSFGDMSYAGQYIIPDSGERYLDAGELYSLSLQELCYARNEIYARHGRRFKSNELQEYFDSKEWYDGSISPDSFDNNILNDYEKSNANMMREYEYSISDGGYQLDAPGYDIYTVGTNADIYPEIDTDIRIYGKWEAQDDFDGDGTLDTVRLDEWNDERYGYILSTDTDSVYNDKEFPDWVLYGVSINGEKLIIVHSFGPSDDNSLDFYQYDQGILRQAGEIKDSIYNLEVDHDTLHAFLRAQLINTCVYETEWRMNEAGEICLVEQDKYPIHIWSNNPDQENVELISQISVYSAPYYDSSVSTMNPQMVHFSYTDGRGWVYMEGMDQGEGWIYARDFTGDGNHLNDYFHGYHQAD